MIREWELQKNKEFNSNLPIEVAIEKINESCNRKGYRIRIKKEKMKRIKKYSPSKCDCLIIENLDHKLSYYSVVIAFANNEIVTYFRGFSRNMQRMNSKMGAKELFLNSFKAYRYDNGFGFFSVLNIQFKAFVWWIMGLGLKKDNMGVEALFYQDVIDAVRGENATNMSSYIRSNNVKENKGACKKKRELLNKKTIAVCVCVVLILIGGRHFIKDSNKYNKPIDSNEARNADMTIDDSDYSSESSGVSLDENASTDVVELDYEGCLKTSMEYLKEGDFESAINTLDTILNQVQNDELSIARIDIQTLQEAGQLYNEGKVASAYAMSMEISEFAEPEIREYSQEICGGCFEHLNEIISLIENKEYSSAYSSLNDFFDFCNGDFYYKDGVIVDGSGETEKCFYADDSEYIYYGDVKDGMQNGKGIEIGRFSDGEYYKLSGEFVNDFANGKCTLVYPDSVSGDGLHFKEIVKGKYTDGYEDGEMTVKIKDLDSEEEFLYEHTSKMGEYQLLRYENGEYVFHDNGEHYQYYTSEDDLKDHGAPRRKKE